MSLPTSFYELEPDSRVAPAPKRTWRGFLSSRRGWIAFGVAVALLFTSAGMYLGYESTLPAVVTFNVKNAEKDVPTDTRLTFSFSHPVQRSAVQSALSIAPAIDGSVVAESGQTQYAWSSTKPLQELTRYTVRLKGLSDAGHHNVKDALWTFTTNIVPHITSVTDAGGTALTEGMELDPGTVLTVHFNDAMEPVTTKVTLGAEIASLKWAADDRSAAISTRGIPSGPLAVHLDPGGRDQTGHLVKNPFTLNVGLYYRDHEHTTALKFPALIQIPNDEFARDQDGLQAADMIFEYLAEGGVTRLTAVYQNAPDLIGPLRSSRFISLKLARHYKGLLFQSGESQATRDRASGDPVPQFFDTIGYTFRSNSRYAPDNLMISGSAVNAAEQSFFASIPAFTIPKGRPALTGGTSAATVNVDEHYSVYSYDAGTGTYQKTEAAHPYADAGSKQPLRIEMLVILHTQETLLDVGDGHGSYIHDFDLDTNGRVDIFYKGMQYAGFWNSTDGHGPLTFTLDNGAPMTLPPGLVFVDVTA